MKKWPFVILISLLLFVIAGCNPAKQVHSTSSTSPTVSDNITDKPAVNGENNTSQTSAAKDSENTIKKPYLYPVIGSSGKWGYINSKGELIIDFIFDHAGFFTDGVAIINQNDKYGLIDPDGNIIIEPQYTYIGSFSEGLAHVVKQDGDILRHGFINVNGEAFYKDFFNNNTGDFHDGLAVFENDLNFGYVNTSGNIVIQPEYFMAYDFSGGYAVVANENDKHGFIDKTGKLVIPFLFDHNSEGTYLYQGFSEGLAAVCKDGKFGYIDEKGSFIIEPVFDYAGRFCEGVALVVSDGLYGYINKKGEYVITPQFAYASSFNNGYAFVRKPDFEDYEEKGGYALIDKSGALITGENLVYEDGGGYTFISEWNTGFINELARVVMVIDEKWQFVYIDKNGEVVWVME